MFVNGSKRNEHIYRGPSIYASYQVSVHLAKGFQRWWLKCEKLTHDAQAILVSDWSISKKSMEGSVLRFLKAEWKVSDTGSAH
jgi:hypothetical protein